MNKKAFLLAGLLLFVGAAFAQSDKYTAGVHYSLLNDPARTASSGKIEVAEAFWYGCPHCFSFEPLISAWVEGKADDLNFVRFPAIFNQLMKMHAQLFFTAESLNVLDVIHDPAYEALILHRQKLQTESQIEDFFVSKGISREDFSKAFNSFSVKTKLRQAESKMKNYQLRGTPGMIVNGKYVVMTGEFVPTQHEMLKVVDFLIEKERDLL